MRNGEKNWHIKNIKKKKGGVGVVGVGMAWHGMAWHGIIIEDSALPGHHSIPRKKVLQIRQPHTHMHKNKNK